MLVLNLNPLIVPISLNASPQQVYARLPRGQGTVLLESSKEMPGLSGWSWVTGPAVAVLQTLADGPTTLQRLGEAQNFASWADPFVALRQVLLSVACAPCAQMAFTGGLVGYVGYDLARFVERLPTQALADPAWPWMHLYLCDHVLAFDHVKGQWYFCTNDWPEFSVPGRSQVWQATLARAGGAQPLAGSFQAGSLVARTVPEDYQAQVQQVLDFIAAGDIFQVNLSHRFEAGFQGDAFALYQELTVKNPAPFSAYMEGPGFALASVSPERFLRLSAQGEVVARPIKGTLPRLPDSTLDRLQRAALMASEKDRAENLMIVDLMRNDLGRVAQVGSVRVDQLFELEAHPSVWQMVSTIRAKLARNQGAVDLLKACWPPGSMTGAPKVRAMEIIDALEPVRRGPYAGALGYFDAGGGMDLSVVIRTALVYQGRVMVQVGGGVVADSRPALELEETHAKGRLLMEVLGQN